MKVKEDDEHEMVNSRVRGRTPYLLAETEAWLPCLSAGPAVPSTAQSDWNPGSKSDTRNISKEKETVFLAFSELCC